MINWKTKGTELYQRLPKECHETLIKCEPLTEIEENRPTQEQLFKTWNNVKGN